MNERMPTLTNEGDVAEVDLVVVVDRVLGSASNTQFGSHTCSKLTGKDRERPIGQLLNLEDASSNPLIVTRSEDGRGHRSG